MISDFLHIIVNSITPLFIILIIALLYEMKFHPDVTAMNDIALKLLVPIFIFKKITDSGEKFKDIYPLLIFIFLLTLLMGVVGNIITKFANMKDEHKTAFISNCTMMNFSNFGIPLLIFTYGEQILKFAIPAWIVFNIPLSTYGIWIIDDDKSIKKIISNIIKIPMFPAFILAILFNELNITVPELFYKPLDFFSQAAIPLMTIIYGMKLAGIKYEKGLGSFLILCIFTRLLISPIIATALVLLLKFPEQISKTLIIMSATPMASTPVMYAIALKKDYRTQATAVLITTIFSAITLPFIIIAIKYLF